VLLVHEIRVTVDLPAERGPARPGTCAMRSSEIVGGRRTSNQGRGQEITCSA
jgi:hypothetical protein